MVHSYMPCVSQMTRQSRTACRSILLAGVLAIPLPVDPIKPKIYDPEDLKQLHYYFD